jgi:hypothetical protein
VLLNRLEEAAPKGRLAMVSTHLCRIAPHFEIPCRVQKYLTVTFTTITDQFIETRHWSERSAVTARSDTIEPLVVSVKAQL